MAGLVFGYFAEVNIIPDLFYIPIVIFLTKNMSHVTKFLPDGLFHPAC
jgi:hypothetical protein